jgi:hypothetical protein
MAHMGKQEESEDQLKLRSPYPCGLAPVKFK